jgi:hypothetical protein
MGDEDDYEEDFEVTAVILPRCADSRVTAGSPGQCGTDQPWGRALQAGWPHAACHHVIAAYCYSIAELRRRFRGGRSRGRGGARESADALATKAEATQVVLRTRAS